MSRYAQDRAWLCRRALGLTGLAGPAEVWQLAEWLGPALTIRQRLGSPAMFMPRRDGGARITLPLTPDEHAEAALLLEEIGHWFCRGTFHPPHCDPARDSRAHAVLDCRRERDEETEARVFADAFTLPDSVLAGLRHPEEAAAYLADHPLDAALFQRRWRQWQEGARGRRRTGAARPVPEPPRWSAWHQFRAELCPAHPTPRLWLRPRDPALLGGRWIELPVLPDTETCLRRTSWSLAALHPEEFCLRHAADLVGPAAELALPWEGR